MLTPVFEIWNVSVNVDKGSGARATREGTASPGDGCLWHPLSSCESGKCRVAVRYSFMALGAVLVSVPVPVGGLLDESGDLPGAPGDAPEGSAVGVELPALRDVAPRGRVAAVTYCGVRPFHHADRPENQPAASAGCR